MKSMIFIYIKVALFLKDKQEKEDHE